MASNVVEPQVTPIVMDASANVTAASTNGNTIDGLEKALRAIIVVRATLIDATSSWQILVQASYDAVTFFDIARSATNLINGAVDVAPENYLCPINAIGDGMEVSSTSLKIPFKASTVLGASAVRPGIPWRALRVVIVRTAVGGGTGLTYSATLYTLNEQSASQGMG